MSTNIRDKTILSFASAMVSLSVFSQSTDQNYLMETTMLDANGTNIIRSVQYYNGLGYPTVSVSTTGDGGQTSYSLVTYDALGRESRKYVPVSTDNSILYKAPGAGCVEYWYDNADRMIFMQDAEMRSAGKYRFYIYDKFNHLVVQGLCSSRPSSTAVFNATLGTSGGLLGTGYSYPSGLGTVELEIANYYDGNQSKNSRFSSLTLPNTSVSQKGLLTGVVTAATNGELLVQAMQYDVKGNVVNSKAKDIGGRVVSNTSSYTFTNQLAQSTTTIGVGYGGNMTVTENIGYNLRNNQKASDAITVNHGTAKSATTTYAHDNLGRLSTLSRPSSLSTNRNVTYAYDLRSWLTGITTSTYIEELFYTNGPGIAYYNGNISSIRWKDNSQSAKRGYKFSYDTANRLTSGAYGEGDALSSNTNRYTETMTYDANGNITTLKRYGKTASGYSLMDNLTISYTGNQPTSVSESAADYNVSSSFEYKKANGSGYKFNANGSLVADKSRGIAYITYDLNNNPQQIYFMNGSVTKYVYSAAGKKLRAVHYTAKPNISRTWGVKPAELTVAQILLADSTDYLLGGSLTMKNGKIDKFLFGGGYAQASVASSTTDNFAFYFYNQDHLGNIREVVNASGSVQQVTNYYPFGAPYADTSAATNADFQPYKYNGKELDKMHGLNTYDYGARQHDPILARWDRIDPLCEKYYDTSPYVYCHDNPVNRVDPDGKDDYFNSAGSFMYSTSNGSDVYVNNVLITDVSLNNDASRQAVANVVGYYANEAGISYYVKGGKSVGDSPSGTVGLAYQSNKDTFAFTRGNDIYVNKSGGHINSYLHDKYNIISTFEHEKEHKNNGHGFGGMTNRAHASVYAKHIGSKTFSKTTKDYQNVVVNSFIEMLKKSITEGATDKVIMSLISDANKGLSGTGMQIVYRRTGSDTDSYNLEVVK